jgi:hypothetical protein
MTPSGIRTRELRLVREGERELPADVVTFAGLSEERQALLLHVHELLRSISHGTVVLVLQDGKILQIETSEKIRLR